MQAAMAEWTTLNYVVVDVEGNGQQPPDLVELATVPIVGGESAIWLVRPDAPITPLARKIHGISNDNVAAAPLFAEIKAEVFRALGGAAIVAHNAHIDVGALRRKLGDWKCPDVFDTLKIARRLLPSQASYRLGSLVKLFNLADGLPTGLMPHRATYDALVTARLFVRLATLRTVGPMSVEELHGHEMRGGEDETPPLF
jgi:exodeoxyribonuclease X